MDIITASLVVSALVLALFIYEEIVAAHLEDRRKKNLETLRNNLEKQKMQQELATLIKETKGKFFSIEFVKKDGTIKKINGKSKYQRLLAGGDNKVEAHGYTSFVDRNRGRWACAHGTKVVNFKCGKLERKFQVA
jgi:hypothetical protein